MPARRPATASFLSDGLPAHLGQYILLDRLSSGGMGEVYRAKMADERRLQRLVAVKCMLPSLLRDKSHITMFINEAKTLAVLNHANIVHVYELGRHRDFLYIVMELVNGQNVGKVVRSASQAQAKLPPAFVAYVISRAAQGLDFVSRALDSAGKPLNLVHRDVSPANILISYDGEVKVSDFGVAKAEGHVNDTRPGVLKGKVAYMAPEQVNFGRVDHRADIFALGAVMFEMLTGESLYSGPDDTQIIEQIKAGYLPDLAITLPPGLDPQWSTILRRALAKNPGDRYPQASDMAVDLERLLNLPNGTYGMREASQLMHRMFAEDVNGWPNRLHDYAQITTDYCVSRVEEDELDSAEVVLQANLPPQKTRSTGWVWVTLATFLGSSLLRAFLLIAVVGGVANMLRSTLQNGDLTALAPGGRVMSPPAMLRTWVNQAWHLVRDRGATLPESDKHFGYIAFPRGQGRPRVMLDGRELGVLPLGPQKVTLGLHEVRFVGDGAAANHLTVVKVTAHNTRQSPSMAY